MGNEACADGRIAVSVCYALPAQVWLRELRLPAGATVADALRESGFAQAFPVVQPWSGAWACSAAWSRPARRCVTATGSRSIAG